MRTVTIILRNVIVKVSLAIQVKMKILNPKARKVRLFNRHMKLYRESYKMTKMKVKLSMKLKLSKERRFEKISFICSKKR